MSKARSIESMPLALRAQTFWLGVAKYLSHQDALSLSFTCGWLHELFRVNNIRKELQLCEVQQLLVKYLGNTKKHYFILDQAGRQVTFKRMNETEFSADSYIHDLPLLTEVVDHEDVTFFMQRDGRVRAEGLNFNSEMGSNIWFNVIPRVIPTISNIKQIACATKKTFFVDDAGAVRVCGSEAHTGLSLGGVKQQVVPAVIPNLPPIKKVLACTTQTVFLAENGDVWASGWVLPMGEDVWAARVDVPQQLPNLKNIVSAFQVAENFIFVDAEGLVWDADGGLNGFRVGRDETWARANPHVRNIVSAQGTWDQTYYLNALGEVWAKGYNHSAELGIGEPVSQEKYEEPVQIPELEGIVKVVRYQKSTLFFNREGNVWTCGRNIFQHFELSDATCVKGENLISPVRLLKFPRVDLGSISVYGNSLSMIEEGGDLIEWENGKFKSNIHGITFNAKSVHYINVLNKYGMSWLDLLNLARSENPDNYLFYNAAMAVLKTKPFPVRFEAVLCYLSESGFYRESDAIELLFLLKEPQVTNMQRGIAQSQDPRIILTFKFAEWYEYIVKKSDEALGENTSELAARLTDMVTMFKIIISSDADKWQQLQNHLKLTESKFTWCQTSLFGYSFSRPTYNRRYHNARLALMSALSQTENGLEVLTEIATRFLWMMAKLPEERKTELMKILNYNLLDKAGALSFTRQ